MKSPLRGSRGGHDCWYWFLEGCEAEITLDGILVDSDCCLPISVFQYLSIEALSSDSCCCYFSRDAADNDYTRAVQRAPDSMVGYRP